MNKQDRKESIKAGKITITIGVFLVAITIYLIGYDFNNNLWNGILLYLVSLLVLGLFRSEKYYIETGCKLKEDIHTEKHRIFNKMYPKQALINNIITYLYIISTVVSSGLIVISFLQ